MLTNTTGKTVLFNKVSIVLRLTTSNVMAENHVHYEIRENTNQKAL
jgi:hypothetical protein